MKTRILLLSMIGILLSFSSCQKIKDSLTVTVPVEFDVDLDVNPGPDLKTGPYPFSVSETLDPNTNQDVKDNIDKIKEVISTGASYTISGLTEDVTLSNAVLSIAGDAETVSWSFTRLPLSNGTVVPLTFTDAQKTKLNDMLDNLEVITVTWTGNQSTPVDNYTLKLKLLADVKAYILGE